MTKRVLYSTIVLLLAVHPALAEDWPQWMGPNRDSVWRETGIVETLPDRITAKWRVPIEWGYSGPAVAEGKVFVMDYVKASGKITNNAGRRDELTGKERVLCMDAETGNLLWKHEYDRPYSLSFPGGPRCTPAVDGDFVFTLGAEGDLCCLTADEGKVVWSKSFAKDFGSKTPPWGHSAHPLVDGDRLFCVVGGEGSVAVAFDKKTGRELWRAMTAPEPGYCPPSMIEHAGVKQLIVWHPLSVNGINPETGDVYWSIPLAPSYRMSIAAPRKHGDLLYACAMKVKAAMIKLDSTKPAAEEVWRGGIREAVYAANTTPFLENGMIYGVDCDTGSLIGARIEDGKRMWESFKPTSSQPRPRHATAFLVKHEDRFFIVSETGDLIIAKLSPEGYEEISRQKLLEPTNTCFGRKVVWSHPAFAQKCIFARNDEEMICVSLAE